MKGVIAVDFDGVIHSYVSGWTGPVPVDPPVLGARDAIATIRALGFEVHVFSCRALTTEGRDGIRGWLALHDIRVDLITGQKPHALLYLDDRGARFNGSWDEILELARNVPRPWNAGLQPAPAVRLEAHSPTCGTCGREVYVVTPEGKYEACGHAVPEAVRP
jgi:hypothetical protein